MSYASSGGMGVLSVVLFLYDSLFDFSQVAEMHGELLEFNEHLQKTIQSKDVYIKRLRDELVNNCHFFKKTRKESKIQ